MSAKLQIFVPFSGASSAVFLVLNIIGGLIAMMAFVAFVNGILAFIGHLFSDPNSQETLTLELIFGYLFYPLAWLLGVDNNDLRKVCDKPGSLETSDLTL